MRNEINDFHPTKSHAQQVNFSQQNSLLSKSSNLLELLEVLLLYLLELKVIK